MTENERELTKTIRGCQNNKRAAQEKLYRQFFPEMLRMCLRYTPDEYRAMEIVNDGFLKVFKNIDQYQFKGSFEGWVRRIVFHCISDHFRRESRYLKFLVVEERDGEYHDVALSQLYYDDLLKLVDTLPNMSREVFRLFALEGFNHKEIGLQLNISEGTSKWHLNNARTKLKERIRAQALDQQTKQNG
jgi:RNA polymerase sigma factor (sigma-70 family)